LWGQGVPGPTFFCEVAMNYLYIHQTNHRVPDKQLNDVLVSAAAQVWNMLSTPTIVYRLWDRGRLIERWCALTSHTILYSKEIH